MKQVPLNKTLIYTGLLIVVAWFGSQGCFPVYSPPAPIQVSPSPCPTDNQGKPACPSPAPR